MATLTNNPNAMNNQAWAAKAAAYTAPKDMTDQENEMHLQVRAQLREFIEDAGAPSISKASTDQLQECTNRIATYIKNGTLGETTKLSISERLVVACWSLRNELNSIAKSTEVTIGRAVEAFIGDFDFEENAQLKAKKAIPAKPTKPKTIPEAPAPMETETYIERPDLTEQLVFPAGESPNRVSELLEAWNLGGDFRLLIKRNGGMAKAVKALNEQDERQTLIAIDAEGKKMGMAYMDKLTQYFSVIEMK